MLSNTPTSGNAAKYLAAAMEFTTSPIAGAVAGHYLDLYFKTDPLLTITMLIAGFIAGTVYLVKILQPPKDNP